MVSRPGTAAPALRGQGADPHRLLEAVGAAVVVTDLDGVVTYCNAAAETLYGIPRERMVGTGVMTALVAAEDVPRAREVMSSVLAGNTWSGDFPVLCGGRRRRLRVTDSPLWHDGSVVGVVGVAVPVDTEDGIPAARLAQLARAIGELADAPDLSAVSEVVVGHVAEAVDAAITSLSVLEDGGMLRLVGLRGGAPGAEQRWATFPLDADLPASEALRRGEVLVLTGGRGIVERYPLLLGHVADDRVLVCLPLTSGARALGVISLSFPGNRLVTDSEFEFFSALADACAQALMRIEAEQEAQGNATRVTFLFEATVELASSLDYRTTLGKVLQLAVPRLADWCAVHVLRDGVLQPLVSAHADPDKQQLTEELQRRYPPDPESPTGVANVVRTGRSELYSVITEELLARAAKDEEHLRLTRELGPRSVLIVPMAARGRIFGALTLVSAQPGRHYTASDQTFAESLARRAAIAIDNADLYTETREAARLLQEAVLPALPEIPGWETAAVYDAAGRTDVGGDFYDVVPVGGQRLAVVVGDVMGRGVGAAAAMAHVRSAIRAYLALDPDPALVLGRLDLMFASYDYSQLVTVACLLVDRGAGELQLASSGHLPPVLVRGDGSTELLAGRPEVPVGVGVERRGLLRARLQPSDTLLLYTDGLVERRDEDIDAGLARLRAAASGLRGVPLREGLERLVAGVRDPRRDDDLTVLAARALSGSPAWASR